MSANDNASVLIQSAGGLDGWDSDLFENQIVGTVVGLYEKPMPIGNIGYPSATASDLAIARRVGAYVQHPNRFVFNDALDLPIEDIYDGPIVDATVQGQERYSIAPDTYGTFNMVMRAHSVQRPFYGTSRGAAYCFIGMSAKDTSGLATEKTYFTASGKSIEVCAIDIGRQKRWNYTYRPPVLGGVSLAENIKGRIITTLNTMADRRHQWSICAHESNVRVELQCYHEEIKSLLYARSLPMTSTGRKKPILHLVASHRRRIKSGIDIDIREFLRGVSEVEMGGALFKVRPPTIGPQKNKVAL